MTPKLSVNAFAEVKRRRRKQLAEEPTALSRACEYTR